MTFPECVSIPVLRLSFSGVFPVPASNCGTLPFGSVGSLRSLLPPPIVPPACAGSLLA